MLNRREWIKLSVTPFAGVWIEIAPSLQRNQETFVTPFAGVWIEIILQSHRRNNT